MDILSLRLPVAAALLAASSILVAVGCSGSANCSSDSDCFAGEVCVDGSCAVDSGEDDTGNADAGDTQQSSDTTDAQDEDTASDTTEDTGRDGEADAGGEDALDAATEGPACVVDKFLASCPDDFAEPNESSVAGYPLNDNSTIGCPTGDEFKTLSETHTTWLCTNETADWYKAIVYPCDSYSFVIEARVTPKTECSRDLWEAGPRNYECSEQNISCAWEGETYIVRRIIEPGNSGLSYYFGLEKTTESLGSDEGLQLEYDVTFETRR